MIESWSARRDELVFRYRAAKAAMAAEQKSLEAAKSEEAIILEAKDVLQTTGQEVQQQAHQKIAGVVTHCLRAVFGPQFRFDIRFERKRGRTEAQLVLLKKDVEVDALYGSGGGVVDVAAFSLRVACLMMTKPPLRRLLVLDEPFRHLSRNYRPRVAELIESMSRELEVQIILVTHDSEFQIGKVVEVG